jgi:hypothetical protein
MENLYGIKKWRNDRERLLSCLDMEKFIKNHFKKIIEKGKNICCVCHHDLDSHIDEEDIWRCHSLGADGWQCECVLRKDRAVNNISYYDLGRRAIEQMKTLELEFRDGP